MSAVDLQALLRFLTQDAKVPLATAMGKVKEMQKAQLANTEDISKSTVGDIRAIFADEKLSKQILSAAKRTSKKRAAGDTDTTSPTKRRKSGYDELNPPSPAEHEQSLALPESDASEEKLLNTILHTNRAPVVLAFALVSLKYTMPEQPLSSRLSLAQAVVSMNSRSKAVSIGLEKGKGAEEEGWGQGQPSVKVMTREIRALKRWGYDWREAKNKEDEIAASQGTLKNESQKQVDTQERPALFALDLEQLKQLNGPLVFAAAPGQTKGLPIYQPEGARSYLLRSLDSAKKPAGLEDATPSTKPTKPTAASRAAEHEVNAAMLLKAIDLLCQSWATVLDSAELDRRAWSWYVKVRPEVEPGVPGWGAKGGVKLADILDLRRKPPPINDGFNDDDDGVLDQMTTQELDMLEEAAVDQATSAAVSHS